MIVQSYCLHAGTHGPGRGKGYLYAPLKGSRQTIIQHILQHSVDHLNIGQVDIQMLIWAILSRTKIHDLQPKHLQMVAAQLLTPKEISVLNGGALGWIPSETLNAISAKLPPPARRVLEAENILRQKLTQAGRSFEEIEHIAVLSGDPPPNGQEIPEGRWSQHPNGFYVRYFPSGFSRTRIQIYVPGSGNLKHVSDTRDSFRSVTYLAANYEAGLHTGSDLGEYDPSGDVAVPGNTESQRLSLSSRPADGGAVGPPPGDQWVSPTAPENVKQKYAERRFKNCEDAERYLNDTNHFEGKTDWKLDIDSKNAEIRATKLPDGSSRAEGRVNYVIDPNSVQITVPKWTWPNMTSSERAALQSFMDALMVHEVGHKTIAEQYAKDWSRNEMLSATGATPREAEANLKARAERLLDERRFDLQGDSNAYDERTEHGARQSNGPPSYPGGKDARLVCP